jgi:hypothetical protein
MTQFVAKIKADPKDILDRYLKGETSTQIAETLNVTRAGLSYWLLKNAEEQWKDAQVVKAIRRKEDAEIALDEAKDVFEVSKAREILKSAQWDLERICRRIYGTDQPQNQSPVVINIGIKRGQTIDVSAEKEVNEH